jgi:hypothetical protein
MVDRLFGGILLTIVQIIIEIKNDRRKKQAP